MSVENAITLEGTLHGHAWSRWKTREQGQVRFWLAVSREHAGDGYDLFLVAIEPKNGPEVLRLEHELTDGRKCLVHAHARSLVKAAGALLHQEDSPGVIFVAEEHGLDGAALSSARSVGSIPRRHHAHGKMAAAGDASELQLEESK